MRRRSRGWTFRRGATWYIGYFADEVKDGRRVRRKVREATGCTKPARKNGRPPTEVEDLLRQRLNDLDAGRWQHPTKPLTFDDLLTLVKDDWRARSRKSSVTAPDGKTDHYRVKHLRAAFGSTAAGDINAVQLARYANGRLDAGAEVSTVRNELNVLKRGLRLARRNGQLLTVPPFPSLNPKNVRTGFFERLDFEAMRAALLEPVRPVVTFMYWTGWRHHEVLSRRWDHVDLTAGVVRLEPGETKNGKGRDFPFAMLPELKAVVEQQRAYTDAVERRTGQDVPWLFHREGKPMVSFRTAWKAACKRVALSTLAVQRGTTPDALWKAMTREERRAFKGLGFIPHDFRRTAVRNLVRAGVSEKVAMELTGHLTRSVFERYNIVSDRDRRDAVGKLAAAFGPKLDPNAGQAGPVPSAKPL